MNSLRQRQPVAIPQLLLTLQAGNPSPVLFGSASAALPNMICPSHCEATEQQQEPE